MTNVSSCYSHKTLSDIADDYKTIIKVYLDNADQDLRESNISIDCQESTPNPRIQTRPHNIKNIACKMQRLQVSFTDRLVEAVRITGSCQCPVHTSPYYLTKHAFSMLLYHGPDKSSERTRVPRRTRAKYQCKVKSLLNSMREYYERMYTKSQLSPTLS